MAAGKYGSADISTSGTDVLVATLAEAAVVCIRATNRTIGQVAVRVAIGTGANPATTDYLEYDVPVPANQVLERGGIVVASGEKIWVRSDTAGVSVRVDGMPAT